MKKYSTPLGGDEASGNEVSYRIIKKDDLVNHPNAHSEKRFRFHDNETKKDIFEKYIVFFFFKSNNSGPHFELNDNTII